MPQRHQAFNQRAADTPTPRLQRTTGSGRVRFRADGEVTRLAELRQAGALRIRLPRVPADAAQEAVVINTAGGLTGGDRLDLAVALDGHADAVVTTAACEKFYRSAGGEARVSTTIALGPGSRLHWLPQPAILFDGGRMRRTVAVDMTADATLIAVEGLILGRTAMGEDVVDGWVHDGWRIRRDGRLILADAFRAGPGVRARLGGAATLRGMRASASVVYVAPDAERRLDAARGLLDDCGGDAAASVWDGVLLVRLAAADGATLIGDLSRFLAGFRARALPRSWLC